MQRASHSSECREFVTRGERRCPYNGSQPKSVSTGVMWCAGPGSVVPRNRPDSGPRRHEVDGSTLTELQLVILRVIWTRGEATTQDVHDDLASTRALAPTTVSTLLSRLEKKGVLAHRRVGRQHVYRALVTEGQVRRSKVRDLTEALFGGDPAALVSHLVRSDEIDEAELAKIRRLLEDPAPRGGGR